MIVWNVCDVCAEGFEWNALIEFSIKFVREGGVLQRLFHDHPIRICSADLCLQSVLPHDTTDFLVIHDNSLVCEPHLNRPPAEF